MSEQWQLRRGTTAENDNFTGAAGEVTMDTDTGALRVHDGVTTGGKGLVDSVVEFQLPTADNNYTWYRKYASGWVEQGGVASTPDADANYQITLPVTMSDVNYSIQITDTTGNTNAVIASVYTGTAITTTGFYIRISHKYYNAGTPTVTYWEVKGMAA